MRTPEKRRILVQVYKKDGNKPQSKAYILIGLAPAGWAGNTVQIREEGTRDPGFMETTVDEYGYFSVEGQWDLDHKKVLVEIKSEVYGCELVE